MPFPITILYAGILALILVVLSVRVTRARVLANVDIMDGGEAALARRIRVQGNFTEYVPLALILIALLEANGAAGWLIHGLGGVLVLARIAHAYGLETKTGRSIGRFAGMIGTFAVLVAAGGQAILQFVSTLG